MEDFDIDFDFITRVWYRPQGFNYIIDHTEIQGGENFRHVFAFCHRKMSEGLPSAVFGALNLHELDPLEPFEVVFSPDQWMRDLPRSMCVGDVVSTDLCDEDGEVKSTIWMECMPSGWRPCKPLNRGNW